MPRTKTHCMGRHRTNRIQSTNAKWACRFEDCRYEMDRELLTFYHRNRQRPERNLGEQPETTSPYCRKTYIAQDKLLMHIELLPHQGTRNKDKCPNLQTEDAPKERWIKTLLKMKGTMPDLRLKSKKFPYQYQPIRLGVKDRLLHLGKEEKARTSTHPRPIARTDDPPKQATEEKPLKHQGHHPPEVAKMQPMIPPPDQQTRKTDEMQQGRQDIWKRHTHEMGTRTKYPQVPRHIGKRGKTNTERKTNKNLRRDKKQYLQGKPNRTRRTP